MLSSDFNLGGEQAEADPLLEEAFFTSGHFRAVDSNRDPRCFLIGRTGSGKSATLQHLEEQHPNHTIRINPEDLSLPYIADRQVVQTLAEMNVHLDPLFIALWKHVLLIEVIRHRYSIDSADAKQNFLSVLRERIRRDRSKRAALEYLEEFEGRFWCETDERVREITDKFEKRISAEMGVPSGDGTPGSASLAGGMTASRESRQELTNRFQRIVNESQLARLNKMITVLDEDILDSEQHFTYIVIDDLDRDWVDEDVSNSLVRCLFRAVIDLKKVSNLKVIVALRTNIFEQLDFGRRTGGQEEKFRSMTLRMRWTKADLVSILDQRVAVAAKQSRLPGRSSITNVLPNANRTMGDPIDYIVQRTLMRPRDAIAYMNQCLVLGTGQRRLTWDDIYRAETPYSHQRLLALRDEWKPSYPDIGSVLRKFEGASVIMDCEDFQERLDESVLLMADAEFAGTVWMTELSSAIWSASPGGTWAETYSGLIRLLFNIGFVGFTTDRPGAIFFYDEPEFAERVSNLNSVKGFAVHPAYRAALDIVQ